MAFTTWAGELARFKNALAVRDTDSFFIMSTENSREMRTMYTKLGNITDFLQWLEYKASMEAAGLSGGGIPMSVGGA